MTKPDQQPSPPSSPGHRRRAAGDIDLLLLLYSVIGVPRWASRMELFGTLKLMARRGLPLADGVREMTTDAVAMPLTHRSRHYNPKQIFITNALSKHLRQGATLSEAMTKASRIFLPYECAMVRAGERAGALPETLDALHHISMHVSRRRHHLGIHIMYPLVLLMLVTLFGMLTIVFVLPKFADIYTQLGFAALPGLTRFFYDLSLALIALKAWQWAVIALAAIVLLIWARHWFYYIPIIGGWLRQNKLGQILVMLGLQLRGGVPVDEALDIIIEMKGSHWTRHVGLGLRESLSQGRSLGESLQAKRLMARSLTTPVILAEGGSGLPDALIESGQQLQEEADLRFMKLIRSIEPVLVLAIAVTTGLFIIAMYLPIFNIPMVIR